MLEKTPMRSTTQEIFAHGHKQSEVCDGVGGDVMELGSKKVQESPEKGCRGSEKPRSTWVASKTHSPDRD